MGLNAGIMQHALAAYTFAVFTYTNFGAWPQYCRKVYWTQMVQTTILVKMTLFPNWILAFARPKWTTKMVHFGPKICIFQTCLALKRAFQPCTKYVFKAFPGGKGLSLVRSLCTPWEALRNKNHRIQTCLRGWYEVCFFGLIFWAFLGQEVPHQGGTWYGTSAKPERHFTKGMFGKPRKEVHFGPFRSANRAVPEHPKNHQNCDIPTLALHNSFYKNTCYGCQLAEEQHGLFSYSSWGIPICTVNLRKPFALIFLHRIFRSYSRSLFLCGL